MLLSGVDDGIRNLLTELLSLEQGQRLMIAFDESSESFAHRVRPLAEKLKISVTDLRVPFEDQLRGAEEAVETYTEHIHRVHAYILCLTAAQETQPVRQRLRSITPVATRIAVMPGFTLDHAALLSYDLTESSRCCAALLHPLWKGSKVEIVSHAEDDVHRLTLSLDSWRRTPIASTGQIDCGHYGNVPGAEAFTAPVEYTAAGTLIVNGALPGLVLPKGKHVALHFDCGRLVEYSGWEVGVGWLRATEAKETGTQWPFLGELGIGTNRSIKKLTGIPLLDEKAFGSAHIALGHNDNFGGILASGTHTDIVFWPHDVLVDGHSIVRQRAVSVRTEDWLENVGVTALNSPEDSHEISATSGMWQLSDEGMVQRRFWDPRGRLTTIGIGDRNASPLLVAVLRQLQNGPATLGTMESALHMERQSLRAVIALLSKAGIVKVRAQYGD